MRTRCWATMGHVGLSMLLAPCAGLPSHRQTITYRNTVAGVAYLGSKVCAGCHQAIYDQYVRTDMGRSMNLASEPWQLAKVRAPVTIFKEKLNRYFQVFRDGPNLYQSEYELNSDGSEVFRNTFKIEYVIGWGANGQGCIVRRGDWLFQAPLSFYSKPKKWDLSPGYEFEDYGFRRPIQPSCIVCHSGQPQPAPQGEGLFDNPPFRELAIGCENCHGPGQLHVEERALGIRAPRDGDRTIVNPARLSSWLADNICMNCHQGGDARVLQPGKKWGDFRPGTSLDSTVAIFKAPFKRESPPASDLLEHYFSMILSKCYRASDGRLSCLSCHDPHREPSSQEAPAFYRSKCLACHTNQSCTFPLVKRLSQHPSNDCVRCHLPKRDIKFIAHSALTNHRIIAREGELLPDVAFQPSTSVSAGLIHVSAVPGKENAEIPPVTLLSAYAELMGSHPEYQACYSTLLDQLMKTQPDNPLVLSALARRPHLQGTAEGATEAVRYLSRAIEVGSTSIVDYQDLAALLSRLGRMSEAIAVLKKGLAISPYIPAFYQLLVQDYASLKKYPEALETMRQEVKLFPEDTLMKKLLKQAESGNRFPDPPF